MAPAASKDPPILLAIGEDDFNSHRRCREAISRWKESMPGAEEEVVDGACGNGGEALKAIARLREAMQTLPFFGTGKIIWLKRCTFLAEDKTSESQAVTAELKDLAQEFKSFDWSQVRLALDAPKVDRRKSFYKAVEGLASVESFACLSVDDRDWMAKAEMLAARHLKSLGHRIDEEALGELVSRVGPDTRVLANEVEKLSLYAHGRAKLELADVRAVITVQKQAKAFALGDAVGDRDLPRVLKALDDELWSMGSGSQKSAIGLLYGVISKVRVMILVQELLRLGYLLPNYEYARIKPALERIPQGVLPTDAKYDPRQINPYVLFRALPQARRYTSSELIEAMASLLECNRKLVGSGLDASLLLQQTLIGIVGRPPSKTGR
ncbi:MAG: DNA polymerase III subunit delta [Verrucomicrobia bacterium]|nr:DNA polymerase III subunit delta [Verrucomicrobiota bacterium]